MRIEEGVSSSTANLRVWRSVVSSPSGVRVFASPENKFGEFLASQKTSGETMA